MIKLSVPGSLMLFGEHAVLYGKSAIVTAVNARLHISLIPNNFNKILIFAKDANNSNKINLELDLNNLHQDLIANQNKPELIYVLECIKHINDKYKITLGFDLDLTTGDLKGSVGFGSSGAVLVGVLAVLEKFVNQIQHNHTYSNSLTSFNLNKEDLLKQSIQVMHKIQYGTGSGADLAASIYGGIISYQNFKVNKVLKKILNLTTIYCGYKVKSIEVIKVVNSKFNQNINYQNLFNHIFNGLDFCGELAMQSIEEEDLSLVGSLMNIAHGYMSGLGVVDATLDKLANNLRSSSGIYGSKVSGAGLGDCVIGLGQLESSEHIINSNLKQELFNLTTEPQGLLWL